MITHAGLKAGSGLKALACPIDKNPSA